MNIDAVDHDTIEIEEMSGAGLCVLCDNAVEAHDVGLCIHRGHAYIAHASCIRSAWEEKETE